MLCAKFGWNWLSGSGEEDFFNFVNLCSLFLYYIPLKTDPSFEQTWIRFTRRCIVPSLVEISPMVFEKKSKIGKVDRRTDRQTDRKTDSQRRTKGDQKSSGELKIQKGSQLEIQKGSQMTNMHGVKGWNRKDKMLLFHFHIKSKE